MRRLVAGAAACSGLDLSAGAPQTAERAPTKGEHFARRCRAVLEIPHDPHLAAGGRIELARLQPPALDAAYRLAALLADTFS